MNELTKKIEAAVNEKGRYLMTLPAELAEMRELGEEGIRNCAAKHGWDVVIHLGGEQIEFFKVARPAPPV